MNILLAVQGFDLHQALANLEQILPSGYQPIQSSIAVDSNQYVYMTVIVTDSLNSKQST